MNWEDYWTSYPKKFGETEYLKQIKNTIGGKPVHVSKIHEIGCNNLLPSRT